MSVHGTPLYVSGPKGFDKFLVYVGEQYSPSNWWIFDQPTMKNDIIGKNRARH